MEGAGTPTSVPKSTFGISATSTVEKAKNGVSEKCRVPESDSFFRSSLNHLSCINSETSRAGDENTVEDENFFPADFHTKRSLANSVLARASQVCAIPSKLFHPDMPSQTINQITDESTINESDLIKTPQNMSTPKCSKLEARPRMSLLSDSISQISEMLDRNSIDNVVQDFLKMSRNMTQTSFVPAEDAASRLMADELSWRKKNEIPLNSLQLNTDDSQNVSLLSIGDYFKAKSDSISDFKTKSPTSHKPVPLIESSQLSTNFDFVMIPDSSQKNQPDNTSKKSLSISAIQQILVEDSPLTALKKLDSKKLTQSSSQGTKLFKGDDDKSIILPSTNTSYSTLFTENHAINMPSNDKENHLDINASGKKSSLNTNASHELPSSRSSSCLTSLSNGKLPIQSTSAELVWGCVKVDKCVTKEFKLKNTSSKSLRLHCTLSTYDFKIRKEGRTDAEFLSSCKFVLHANESRPFYVTFCPTKIGAAYDELCFLPLDASLVQTKKQAIRLNGYGGYACAEFQNLIRDNTGKMWLSFGKLDNRLTMDKLISIKNSGNIPLFTYIKVHPKHNLTASSFKINVDIFVLSPGEEKTIQLSYVPNSKDINVLKQYLIAIETTDVGKLEIVSGSEANRARLKRLCRKSSEKGKPLDSLCQTLSGRISGEIIPGDIKKLQETSAMLPEILEMLHHHEVILTVEQDPNQTLIGDFNENSENFQSLFDDETLLGNVSKLSQKFTRLEPSCIILSPPNKVEDCLYLSSDATSALGFEVSISPQGLEIFPPKGVVLPGETEIIRIKCKDNVCDKNFKVSVYLESSDVHEVDIKILNIQNSNVFLE